jgi:hypothetical protein
MRRSSQTGAAALVDRAGCRATERDAACAGIAAASVQRSSVLARDGIAERM